VFLGRDGKGIKFKVNHRREAGMGGRLNTNNWVDIFPKKKNTLEDFLAPFPLRDLNFKEVQSNILPVLL
jgi:hypothetical protein